MLRVADTTPIITLRGHLTVHPRISGLERHEDAEKVVRYATIEVRDRRLKRAELQSSKPWLWSPMATNTDHRTAAGSGSKLFRSSPQASLGPRSRGNGRPTIASSR